MTEQDPPQITFPCEYPIKVILENEPEAHDQVIAVFRQLSPEFTSDRVTEQPSAKGKYVSIRVQFWALSENQLQKLFGELKTISAVRMVL